MKYVLPLLLVLGVGLIALGLLLGKNATPVPPNVVLVVMDTLRVDRVEATRNGEPIMPFFDSLLREGTWFSRAMSASSWTKPAMASVLTGLSPQAHGAIYTVRQDAQGKETSDVLPMETVTMAEWLWMKGYDRWAFQTNANLKEQFGFAQGYEAGHYNFENGAPASKVTDEALKALGQLEPPFFLYAHYMDPHAPYTPPEYHRDLFGPLPEVTAYDNSLLRDPGGKFMRYYVDRAKYSVGLKAEPDMEDLSPGGKQAVEHLYDALVRYMDGELARLVAEIRKADPNTVFIFLSDHGEEFWERGGMGHGTTLYQEQEHVPFLMVGPDIPAQRIDSTVSTLELLPTLAAYLNNYARIDGSTRWEGRDLFEELDPNAPIFAYTRASETSMKVHAEACYQGDYSYIEDLSHGWQALYNRAADPDEEHDLSQEDPDRVAVMSALLQGHRERVNAMRNSITRVEIELDPITAAEQQLLGYGGNP